MDYLKQLKEYAKTDYINKLSNNEKISIKYYTQESHKINSALRSDDGSDYYFMEYINDIDNAIDKFENKHNLILYRKLLILSNEKTIELIKKFEKTKEIIDKAYMSCSINLSSTLFSYNILLQIDFPISAPGAYIDYISNYNEEEFLIARNQKLEVLDIINNKDKFIVKTKMK